MLTLEKLAPYLAHDLKAVGHFDGHQLIRDVTLYNATNFVDGTTKDKILCHPLSSLTKPIKVEGYNEGKEFVPMDVFRRMVIEEKQIRKEQWSALHFLLNEYTDKISPNLPYWVVELLYRWHFAINLDPEDFVDIKTLEK